MGLYGRDDVVWDQLAQAGLEFLIGRARLRKLTSYTEFNATLIRRTGLPGFEFSRADERAAMGHLLYLIVDLNRPLTQRMISALVTYLHANDAGSGFYAYAQNLGCFLLKLQSSRGSTSGLARSATCTTTTRGNEAMLSGRHQGRPSAQGGWVGLLNRMKGARKPSAFGQPKPAHLLGGNDDLEVVGELAHQDVFWRLCGGVSGDKIRCDIIAALVPEPTNPYDANAIAVQIDGQTVGYLPRATAQEYLPGLHQLMSQLGGSIGLRGVIVGGGYYDDGPGRLGVWLDHNPSDFGVHTGSASWPPNRGHPDGAVMRTGFTEAWLTDAEDDSYDLSWFNDLPEADRPAIAKLRELLAADPDPIDRHFQFCELETRLYRSRDLYGSALAEFDEICDCHDAEMEGICAAFMAKWGKIPLLDTYRQMAIRQQKQKDWQACKRWAERGLDLYGQNAAREDAVEDLIKRRNRAAAKLEERAQPRIDHTTVKAPAAQAGMPANPNTGTELEVLTCQQCSRRFERMRVRGRKPGFCPQCRAMTKP